MYMNSKNNEYYHTDFQTVTHGCKYASGGFVLVFVLILFWNVWWNKLLWHVKPVKTRESFVENPGCQGMQRDRKEWGLNISSDCQQFRQDNIGSWHLIERSPEFGRGNSIRDTETRLRGHVVSLAIIAGHMWWGYDSEPWNTKRTNLSKLARVLYIF